jgi:hypothetical protein
VSLESSAARRAARSTRPDRPEFFPFEGWLSADPDQLAERYRRLYVPDLDGRHLQRNARVASANLEDDLGSLP